MELSPVLKQQFTDSAGVPLVGGKLFSYQAGTSTPKPTFTDRGGLSANTNPIILDGDGRADVWLDSGAYRFELFDANDVLLFETDNVVAPSGITNAGSFSQLVLTSSDVTVTLADNNKFFLINTTAAARTVTLPLISSLPFGFRVGIKRTGANNITINRSGTDQIETASSKVLSDNLQGVLLQSDSTVSPNQWFGFDNGNVANKLRNSFGLVEDVLSWRDLGFDASAPSAGFNNIYTKAQGIYRRTSTLIRKIADSGYEFTRTITANTTTNVDDELILCNAAAGGFTLTFEAASLYPNRIIKVKKTDSSFNSVLITGTGMTNNRLMTVGEFATFQSIGGNWVCIYRQTDTEPISYTMTFANATPPTRGTVVSETCTWQRVSDSIKIYYQYASSGTGTTGTGQTQFRIPNAPSGWTMNFSRLGSSGDFNLGTCMVNALLIGYITHNGNEQLLLYLFNETIRGTFGGGGVSSYAAATNFSFQTYPIPMTDFEPSVR